MNSKLKENNAVHPQTIEVPQPLEIHPSVSPLAAELLMKVSEVLAIAPSKYNQQNEFSRCDSPCCIIGHMRLLNRSKEVCEPKEIGLTEDQEEKILHVFDWPDSIKAVGYAWMRQKFGECNTESLSRRAPASLGIARIEHFLRTGE